MTIPKLASIGLLSLCACPPPSIEIITTAPPEVNRIGAVVLNDRGQVLGATALLPRLDSVRSQLASLSSGRSDITTVVLLGYSDDVLARAAGGALPAEATLSQAPLRLAGPSDPLLPRPGWAVEGDGGSGAMIAPGPSTRALELTTTWLPRCPNLAGPGRKPILATCTGQYCESFDQSGCEISAQLESCLAGAPEHFTVGPRGEVEGTGMSDVCRGLPTTPGASFSFTCGTCRVDGLLPPFTTSLEATPGIQVEAVSNPGERISALTSDQVGYILGLAPLPAPSGSCPFNGQRVVTLTRNRPKVCEGEASLVVVSSDSLEVVGRANLGRRCVRGIVADPAGDGVLVVSDSPRELLRFGCDLELLEAVPLASTLPDEVAPLAMEVVELAPGRSGVVIGLQALAEDGTGLPVEGNLAEVDPQDLLSQRVRVVPGHSFGGTLAGFGVGQVVASIIRADQDAKILVGFLDLRLDPIAGPHAEASLGAKLPEGVVGLVGLSRKRQVLWTSAPDDADPRRISVLRLASPGAMPEAEIFDYTMADSDLSAVQVWRAAPSRPDFDDYAVVASTVRDPMKPQATKVGLVNLLTGRLEPGRLSIGFGPVGVIRPDQDGALWLPLPWQGTIVRVRPAASPQVVP